MAIKTYKKDGKILITGLIVERDGKPDGAGNVLDLSGMKVIKNLMVIKDFGHNVGDIIGEVTRTHNNANKELVADLLLYQDIPTGWPAIGGRILQRDKDDPKKILKFELTSISINCKVNIDPTIQPLHIQITHIKDERQKNQLCINGPSTKEQSNGNTANAD